MKPNMYCVRDAVAGVYLAPVLAENDGAARRMLHLAVSDSASPISKSPADYTIERVGSFDRETGTIVACPPVVVCHASDFAE